jgi:hypothetical protein
MMVREENHIYSRPSFGSLGSVHTVTTPSFLFRERDMIEDVTIRASFRCRPAGTCMPNRQSSYSRQALVK